MLAEYRQLVARPFSEATFDVDTYSGARNNPAY
jgi:hypothetical protein